MKTSGRMKEIMMRSTLGLGAARVMGVVVAVAFASIDIVAHAATNTWDVDTGTTGAQDGSGVWSTSASNTNWWNGVANVSWNSGDSAIIGAGSGAAGTITLGETISVGNLILTNATSGSYVITNNALNFGIANPSITLAPGVTGTLFSASASNTRDLDILFGSAASSLTLAGSSMAFESIDTYGGSNGTLVVASGATVTTIGHGSPNVASFGLRLVSALTINGSLIVSGNIGTYSADGGGTILVNNGGSLTANGGYLGWNSSKTLTINSGGIVDIGPVYHQDGGTGTLNLNAGGTLKADRVYNQAGSLAFNVNFNGGLLIADADVFQPINTHNEYADFKLMTGGLILDIPSGKNSTLIRPFQQNGPLTKTGVGVFTMAGSDSTNVITVQGGTINLHAGLHEMTSSGSKTVVNSVPAVAPIVLDGGNLGVIGRTNAPAIGPRTFTYNATTPNTNFKILRLGNTSGLAVGMGITGANIPDGAYITHILDGTTLRMSVNATGGTTGTTAVSFDAADNNISLQTFNTVDVRQPATLTVDNNGGSGTTLTIANLTGSGDLTKDGAATLALYGTNSLSGTIAVNQGTLDVSAPAPAVYPMASISVAPRAVLNLKGGAVSVAALSGGGLVTNSALSQASLTVGRDNSSTRFWGSIDGDIAFTKTGSGTLTLSSANSYSGAALIQGGTLQLAPVGSVVVSNASFEAYDTLDNVTWGYKPTGASWTFPAGTGIAEKNSPWVTAGAGISETAAGFIQTSSSFSNVIAVAEAGWYTISFLAGKRPAPYPATQLFVNVDGVNCFDVATNAFTEAGGAFSAAIPLSSGTHTLTFRGMSPVDSGIWIDQVAITSMGGRLPAGSVAAVAAGATLDLGGNTQTINGLSGSGMVTNGVLSVTGTIAPGGTNVVGTLTLATTATLSGTLLIDVATDGSCDVLQVQGNLNVSNLNLTIQDLNQLGSGKPYVIVRCTPGGLSGRFLSTNLAERRSVQYDNATGEVRLISRGTFIAFY